MSSQEPAELGIHPTGFDKPRPAEVLSISAIAPHIIVEEVQALGQAAEHIDSAETPLEITLAVLSRHEEMGWLTGDVESTPEKSVSGTQATLAEEIYPNKAKTELIEFDRTAVGILALHWVLKGDYKSFTDCQAGPTKLTQESFAALKAYTHAVLQTDADFDAMETFMVINDLGKITEVVETVAKRTGLRDVDHDKVLLVGLENHPDISPSFERLSPHHQKLILNGLRTKFNIGQFIQGENVPASLEGLVGIDSESLQFYLLHTLYDIAGAAGQSVQNGSLIMNEPTYQNFQMAIASLEASNEKHSIYDAYDMYITQKGKTFGLDATVPTDRAVIRLCCMLRVSDPNRAQEVLATFNNLPTNTRAILESDLNISGVDDAVATLIYYAPAILANIQKNYAENGSNSVPNKDIIDGFGVLARVFQEARIEKKHKDGNGVFTVMAASLAKAASEDPELLQRQNIRLNILGGDAETALKEIAAVDTAKFDALDSLAEIPGHRIVPIGIGGGSDCVQASMLGQLLKQSGKECPAIISIRTQNTGSQGNGSLVGEPRMVEGHGGEISPGVYKILPQTTGTGRFLESIPSEEFPVYLIVEQPGVDLSGQIDSVLATVGEIDTVIGVDTGGDALYSTVGHDESLATPDQDLRSLEAIAKLASKVRKLSCEIAVGIDTPQDGEEVLRNAGAVYYLPTNQEADSVLAKYKEWQMDGSNDDRFGKTSLAWQEALQGRFGVQSLNLPTRVVLDKINPWNPFVHIQPSTRALFFMNVGQHLKAIGGPR